MPVVLIKYSANPVYYPDGGSWFDGEVRVDLDKLRDILTNPRDLEDGSEFRLHYAEGEAEQILQRIDTNTTIYGLEEHDKYTFFDTDWEAALVAPDNPNEEPSYEIEVLLNA